MAVGGLGTLISQGVDAAANFIAPVTNALGFTGDAAAQAATGAATTAATSATELAGQSLPQLQTMIDTGALTPAMAQTLPQQTLGALDFTKAAAGTYGTSPGIMDSVTKGLGSLTGGNGIETLGTLGQGYFGYKKNQRDEKAFDQTFATNERTNELRDIHEAERVQSKEDLNTGLRAYNNA